MAIARGSNQRLTLLILLLVSVTAVTLDYHGPVARGLDHVRNGVLDVVSPFQRATTAVLHPIGDVVSGAIHYGQLETQNAQLRSEIGSLQRSIAQQNYALRAASKIQSLDKLPYADVPTVPAQVIAPATSNFERTIQINVGTDEGAGPGMPVVGLSGLVGTIASSSSSQSIVELVTDARSGVGVELDGADFRAIGTGSALRLEQLQPKSIAPRLGQRIVTSGQDNGAYPPGLPVGRVTHVTRNSSGAITSIAAAPVVNFTLLEYVAVLEWLAPA